MKKIIFWFVNLNLGEKKSYGSVGRDSEFGAASMAHNLVMFFWFYCLRRVKKKSVPPFPQVVFMSLYIQLVFDGFCSSEEYGILHVGHSLMFRRFLHLYRSGLVILRHYILCGLCLMELAD